MRLFVAIAMPEEVSASLLTLQSGVPGARWTTREQMHLTLRFIGECDGRAAAGIDDALASLSARPFSLALKSVGQFGGRKPSSLWAGVESDELLFRLQRKIEIAVQRAGLPAETRKFTPHVTLARLKSASTGRVMDYIADHGLYRSPAFEVGNFILYSSQPTPNGSLYVAERSYTLRG